MLFKEFFGVIDEMKVHGDIKTAKHIVAYKGNIWVLADEESPETIKNILSVIGYNPDEYGGDEADENWNDLELIISSTDSFHDLVSFLHDRSRSDVLAGYLTDKKLHVVSTGPFVQDPKSSILIKKVVKALKLSSVSYDDDFDSTSTKVGRSKIVGEIPNTAFHGTSSKYIMDILKIGLRPMQAPTNYSEIEHQDAIFFATRFGEAMHHASHTASKTKSLPIVIEFIIPDKNLILPDYDIDTSSGMTHYSDLDSLDRDRHRKNNKMGSEKSLSMSREHGVYGYQGSIMPRFIKNVYVGDKAEIYSLKDMKKFTVKQFKRMVDMGYFDIY